MLLDLFAWLSEYYGGFRVFGYLTLRAIFAALTALTIALFVGPTMIRMLAARQIGQVVRDDGPGSHLGKKGTPTMGGALILIAVTAGTLLWADLTQPLRLDRAHGHARLRPDRLLRRLPEARRARPARARRALEVPLAVAGGPRRGARALADRGHPGRDRALRAVLQERRAADGRRRVRRPHVLRDRRHAATRST